MAEKKVKDCQVAIGTNKINGIGTFSYGGVVFDDVEKTQLGDQRHLYTEALYDGSDFSFDGWFDPDDTNGQVALRTANKNAEHMTDLRFHADANSYYVPESGLSPASYAKINSWQNNGERAGLVNIVFSGKIYGAWDFV